MIRLFRLSVLASLFAVACGPSGKAPPTCSAGQLVCAPASGNAFCANLQTDSANCGACGVACPNPTGSTQIQCVAGTCQTNCGGGYSSTSKVVCGASGGGAPDAGAPALYCADLIASHDNCGKCGNACGSTEVCRNGACDACPVAQCSNVCVDTQHDPANCGACGTTANYCENGAPLAKIAIELVGSLTLTPPLVGPSGTTTFPIAVKVHSQLRVTSATISVNGAAATALGLSSPQDVSPTIWTTTISIPAAATVNLDINAYDEAYLASRSDAAQHTDRKNITANVLPAPTTAPSVPTVMSGTIPVGVNTGGNIFKWVPLNAPDLTISSQVPTGQNISQIEFRNTAAGSGCPPACVLGRGAVNASGQASITLSPGAVGKGDLTVYACSFDIVGAAGPCTAGPAFTIGRIASQPVIMGKNIDASNSRTLYYLHTDTKIYAQDYAQLNINAADLPGQVVGADTFTAASLAPTFEGTGVYAVKAGGTAVERIDCPTPTAGCIKPAYVVPSSGLFKSISVATGAAILIAGTLGTDWYYAQAKPTQTTDTAVAVGTLVTNTGLAAASSWQTTQSGAIVAWFNNGGNFAPVLFHPNVAGNHALPLITPKPSLTNIALQVYPTGEIIFQYTDAGNTFVGGAYFDGTAAPTMLAPVPVLASGGISSLNSTLYLAKRGVILVAVTHASANDLIEVSLTGTPQVFRPSPSDGTNIVTLIGGINARVGTAYVATSDDQTKAVYNTRDAPASTGGPNVFRLRLLDLATGAQVPLYGSETLLNDIRAFPHFVHSAPVYVGGAPAGTHQAVVWWEQLPFNAGSQYRHGRISFATYSGSGAPAVSTVDRLVTYWGTTPSQGFSSEMESATAGAIFFLSDNDAGGSDLYLVPLTPPAGPLTTATKVMDRVFGFKLREDKSALLVERSDGVLFYAQLTPGTPPALQPITNGGPQGDPNYSGDNSSSYGFTPDGDHAYVVRDQVYDVSAGLIRGMLQTVDVHSGARTNWGRIAYPSNAPITAGFLASASVVALIDTYSVENAFGRLVIAKASSPTTHADTNLFSSVPSAANTNFSLSTSMDGSEGFLSLFTTGANSAIEKDGTFVSLPASSETRLSQAATNSPFGGPYRPEYSQVDVTLSSGAPASLFKIWGGATPGPFVPIIRGAAATPAAANTRQTPDNKELLYSFTDGDATGPCATTGCAYGIGLPLSGKAPPPPLPP